ncbi:MAG: DUF488 domain-containing protein [Nitrospirae bacterium]|nr:DUF488 domain-containing protein [Nitrospirota bacterium]MCL5238820.1 DUF488 domain-containing protein [Nitrospirota bacterium]
MVKVKRIYEQASPDDGRRILVDRLWPRGIKKDKADIDEWVKEIAPSNELRKWFSHEPSRWQEFKSKYKDELKGKTELVEKLRAGKGTTTLLFSARDAEHNNAVALKEILEGKHNPRRGER